MGQLLDICMATLSKIHKIEDNIVALETEKRKTIKALNKFTKGINQRYKSDVKVIMRREKNATR